jgi:hypothetical protein
MQELKQKIKKSLSLKKAEKRRPRLIVLNGSS